MKKLTFESASEAQEAAIICNQLGVNSNLQIQVRGNSIFFIGTQPTEALILLLRHRWGLAFKEDDENLAASSNRYISPKTAQKENVGTKKNKKSFIRLFFGWIFIIFGLIGNIIVISGKHPTPLFGFIWYSLFFIGGLLLIGVKFNRLFKKKTGTNEIEAKTAIINTPNPEKPISEIIGSKSENEDNKKFFESEYEEQTDDRKYNFDPSFAKVLDPLNNSQYEVAINEGNKILEQFFDFDILYSWIGSAYTKLSKYDQAKNILSEGLKKSKRKCGLLIDLAEVSWRLNSLNDTIYYLSQALCCSIKIEEYKIYLLLHYISKGMGLEKETLSFLNQVDNLRAGQIRYNSIVANQIINLSGKMVNPKNKQLVIELNKRYLS